MNKNKPLGKFTVPQLRQLIRELAPLEAFKGDLFETFRKIPERLNEILTPNYSWVAFYEYPIEEHLALAATIMKLAPAIQAAADSDDPQQMILDRLSDDFLNWNGGPDGKLELKHLFGAVISVIKSLECVMLNGRYLNDFVHDVRIGDAASLFEAVRIDRSIIGAPTIADRIARAEIDGDESFFEGLKKALNGKRKKQWARYNRLRFALHALTEAGVVTREFSDNELKELFMKALDLYPDRSTDSVRGLRNFVNKIQKPSRI